MVSINHISQEGGTPEVNSSPGMKLVLSTMSCQGSFHFRLFLPVGSDYFLFDEGVDVSGNRCHHVSLLRSKLGLANEINGARLIVDIPIKNTAVFSLAHKYETQLNGV